MALPELPRAAPQLATLADELLEEIFLRVPEAADLARASATCPNFRRIIADHSFLRRFRALHPPPLLGILSVTDGFIPAQPPHPSAAAARAFAGDGATDFWCSFLPSHNHWIPRDFRDGRALLSAAPEGALGLGCERRAPVRELAVCDPVHRRYLLLPAIPDDFAELAHQPETVKLEAFLAPTVEDEGGTSFRVICLVESKTKLVAFIYSSCSGQWHAAPFDGWVASITGNRKVPSPLWSPELFSRYHAHGCFYWPMNYREKLLVLDSHSMEFSVIDCPHASQMDYSEIMGRAIMEAGKGRIGMLTLCDNSEYSIHLRYTVLQNDDQGANKWRSEAVIPLPLNYFYNIMGIAGGYLLLQRIAVHRAPVRQNFDCFSLNLKTLELEWFCRANQTITFMQPYAGFPPSLSAPTI